MVGVFFDEIIVQSNKNGSVVGTPTLMSFILSFSPSPPSSLLPCLRSAWASPPPPPPLSLPPSSLLSLSLSRF